MAPAKRKPGDGFFGHKPNSAKKVTAHRPATFYQSRNQAGRNRAQCSSFSFFGAALAGRSRRGWTYPLRSVLKRSLRMAWSRIVLFGFSEGQELTGHTSTQNAVIQILSGECEFSLDGKLHTVKAGDFIYMPPNLPHAVRATTQFSVLLTLSKPEAPDAAAKTNLKKS